MPRRFPAPTRSAPPTREEVNRKVVEAQQKLAELKRAQEDLERERASLEELRRRQLEFQNGRQEMIQQLTRGLGLLEEAEFNSRRETEQMVKTITDFREALGKIQSIHDEIWSKGNFQMELTRALTTIENARMEWNSARLKLPALAGEAGQQKTEAQAAPAAARFALRQYAVLANFVQSRPGADLALVAGGPGRAGNVSSRFSHKRH